MKRVTAVVLLCALGLVTEVAMATATDQPDYQNLE